MPLSVTAVIDVLTAQADPSIGLTVPASELEPLIGAVSVQIDRYLDRPVIQRQVSETRLLGRRTRNTWKGDHRVILDRRPVASIASIQDQAAPTPQSMALDQDYYLHKEQGYIESLHLNGFPEPIGFWTITYTAGLVASRANVDQDIRRAAILLIVAHRSMPDPTVTRERIGNLEIQRAGGVLADGELPPNVRVLLDQTRSLGM